MLENIEMSQGNKNTIQRYSQINRNIQQTLPILNETNLIQYYNTLTNIIQTTVKQIIPKKSIYIQKFYHDNILTQTSELKKEILMKLRTERDLVEIRNLKVKRAILSNRINQKVKKLYQQCIQNIAQDIEANKTNSKCFYYQKLLRKKIIQIHQN